MTTRSPSWHRLGPRDMPLEFKRFRHVASDDWCDEYARAALAQAGASA
ncbi:MAG: hypothetical protein ACLP3C_18625 [Mycobacterium sp.]